MLPYGQPIEKLTNLKVRIQVKNDRGGRIC
jgi:hypothetical protein